MADEKGAATVRAEFPAGNVNLNHCDPREIPTREANLTSGRKQGLADYKIICLVFVLMKSHELLRDIFHDSNPKQIAEDLGLSLSMIYKWAEPSGEGLSGTPNPLDRVAALVTSTRRTDIAQWVCECSGGFFVKNASDRHFPRPLLEATHALVQEVAEVLSVVSSAAIDNRINEAEAKAIRRRWEKLKSLTEGFVMACEKGDFHSIEEQAATIKEKL